MPSTAATTSAAHPCTAPRPWRRRRRSRRSRRAGRGGSRRGVCLWPPGTASSPGWLGESRGWQSRELAGGGLEDADVQNISWCDIARAQDIGPLALPDPPVRTVELVAALDQDLSVAADPPRGLPRRDVALQRQQVVQPTQLLFVRHVVDQPAG